MKLASVKDECLERVADSSEVLAPQCILSFGSHHSPWFSTAAGRTLREGALQLSDPYAAMVTTWPGLAQSNGLSSPNIRDVQRTKNLGVLRGGTKRPSGSVRRR